MSRSTFYLHYPILARNVRSEQIRFMGDLPPNLERLHGVLSRGVPRPSEVCWLVCWLVPRPQTIKARSERVRLSDAVIAYKLLQRRKRRL
ncbi:hypothetical protein M413DRAFT_116453 [Hebeloma cylindrosporum]|uniref:Uncharacterized protein n=1 Tax=Hebeloma cylindrosporum TaxID=76867 RepID=A0A0C3D062_HEBCY|nr:hypothetical protein M413DRAFT_116453 [Hebeloma cylindrosporum h7]